MLFRKLGEGAFGTVYGGEAYFDEKEWVSLLSTLYTFPLSHLLEQRLFL